MKRLTVHGMEFIAVRIVKGENSITGLDAQGNKTFEFTGITDMEPFVLEDGAVFDQPAADSLTLTAAIMGGTEMANEHIGHQINRALQFAAQSFTEEQALEIADLYPVWEPDKEYAAMYIVKHGTKPDGKARIFQVMQAHTTQSGWEPPNVPALFKELGFTDEGVPIWVQPQGGHDAYKTDDVVMHNGKKWKSTANGNVWEPGVYGWIEIPL